MKKLVTGEGDCTYVKEVLGWILYTDAGTVTLPERKIKELLTLVDIPATQLRMGQKDMERLVGENSIYAPHGAWGSGPSLPHSVCAE